MALYNVCITSKRSGTAQGIIQFQVFTYMFVNMEIRNESCAKNYNK